MATKNDLLNVPNAGDGILAASKCSQMTATRFSVVITAPDDRRVDKALEEDKSLRKDLAAACSSAYEAYVATMAAFLAAEEKAWLKLKEAERKPFIQQFSNRLYKADKEAGKTLESTAIRDTQKIWKKFASGNDALKGVRFEPLLVPYLAAFDLVADKKAEAEEEDLGKEVGLALQKLQLELNLIATQDLRRASSTLPDIPAKQDKVNVLLAKLAEDYESGPRESQKDNPETSGDEEPDEQALNAAIFAEHGRAIAATRMVTVDLYGSCSQGAGECATAAKGLVKLIKQAGKVASHAEKDNAKAIEKNIDQLGDVVKKLVALQAELKADLKPIGNSMAIFEALENGKGGALGLLDRAKLKLVDRGPEIKAILKALKDNAFASRIA